MTLHLSGAEETQRMKTVASSMPSAAADIKSVVAADHNKHDTQTAKSASILPSKPHQAGASSSTHVQASFQRPIRPTQVEPSMPDLQSASSGAKPKPLMQLQLQPQQQPPFRPPMHNAPQSRRSALIFHYLTNLLYVVTVSHVSIVLLMLTPLLFLKVVVWHSDSMFDTIHWARLVLGWVTICGFESRSCYVGM